LGKSCGGKLSEESMKEIDADLKKFQAEITTLSRRK
jgi:hypothetical protein